MMLTRFADRVILDISENLARLGGWRREDAIGRTPSELGFWIDPGDWDRVHARLAEQAGPVEQEEWLSPSGSLELDIASSRRHGSSVWKRWSPKQDQI